MSCGHIEDSDSLYRHSRYPVSFQGKQFNPKRLWKLYSTPDGLVEASVAWDRYVPTPLYVHEYGCRISSKTNDKIKAAGKFTDKSRHVYCGAYRLAARS